MGIMRLRFTKLTINRRNEFWYAAGLLFLPILILVPAINKIPFPTLSPYSDLVISHLPNLFEVRNSLMEFHRIPLWSESIFSGYPFISDPLSSIWYPPLWITWFLPIPFSINLLIIIHIFFAELGMFIFLRKSNSSFYGAIIGAFIIGYAPKIWGHFAAGHITLVFAYAWTPWLLLFLLDNQTKAGLNRYMPGLIMAWIIFADLRWFVYSLFVYIFYGLFLSLVNNNEENLLISIRNWIKRIILNFGITLAICLPFLLLLFQYSSLSTRNIMTVSDQLALSLPAEALLGFVFPDGRVC
jgi:hypothetical protein